MSLIDTEIEHIRQRIASERRRHRPVSHLHYLKHRLRLAQIQSEIREDELTYWVRESNRAFNRRWQEEHGT
ncbi:MAG: hypothetical protein ACM3IH_20460 [Sphingobacteriales bacterium]